MTYSKLSCNRYFYIIVETIMFHVDTKKSSSYSDSLIPFVFSNVLFSSLLQTEIWCRWIVVQAELRKIWHTLALPMGCMQTSIIKNRCIHDNYPPMVVASCLSSNHMEFFYSYWWYKDHDRAGVWCIQYFFTICPLNHYEFDPVHIPHCILTVMR